MAEGTKHLLMNKREVYEAARIMPEPLIESMKDSIEVDHLLDQKQKLWLVTFFTTGRLLIDETNRITGTGYYESWLWRRNKNEKDERFQWYIASIRDIMIHNAERGLFMHINDNNLDAIKFALTKLHTKYAERLDITSNFEPLTKITIVDATTNGTSDKPAS